MSRYVLSWKIGGEAGFGIKSAGLTFAQVCNRAGYEVFSYDEYPSLIRGGHNTNQVTVSESAVHATAEHVDVLVALTPETITKHATELSIGAAVIYNSAFSKNILRSIPADRNAKLIPVPFAEITAAAQGTVLMRNTVALGASVALVGVPFDILRGHIKKTFSKKQVMLDANIKAARAGYDFVVKRLHEINFKVKLEVKKMPDELLLTGNDALCLGALAAGVQFYAAYPMTPSSSLLHYFASHARDQKMIVKHAEDEISVINMALGASHVGARAMIGTSGGGFSLMVESLGLAGITETPLVIVEAQRPGPATGLPTWTEQGDLRFVMHAAQGEFPRIILAPGDHEECFTMAADAFNLAEKYQLPVIILTDKLLAESARTVAPFNFKRVKQDRGLAALSQSQLAKMSEYRRYRATANGVSGRSIPGTRSGEYLANSDEHDEYGWTSETRQDRMAQMKKRMTKLTTAAADLGGANLYGNPRAKLTVIAWGSSKGPILDAIAWLPDRLRRKVNFLHINVMWPFPSAAVTRILERSKRLLTVESNYTGQLRGVLRETVGFNAHHQLLKYDGRPLYPLEIKERIVGLL